MRGMKLLRSNLSPRGLSIPLIRSAMQASLLHSAVSRVSILALSAAGTGEQTLAVRADDPIALAGRCLHPCSVEDCDSAMAIRD